MILFINKLISNNPIKRFLRKHTSPKGQAALVLLLLIAFTLIFYAVSVNLGRISQTKTVVTIASNSGASFLASSMSSVGQRLFMETLGGKRKICQWTGLFGAIISAIIMIIAIIVSIITANPGPILVALMIIGGILALAAIIIQAVYVNPTITSLYNKIRTESLTTSGQFIDSAIEQGLTKAVGDIIQVPDMLDLDQDQKWGYGADGKPVDKISRFGVYYYERLREIDQFNVPEIRQFMDALKEFVYDDPFNHRNDGNPATIPDDWGVYDPLINWNQYSAVKPPIVDLCTYDVLGEATVPSECNPCCVPIQVKRFDIGPPFPPTYEDVRPACCDNGQPPIAMGGTGCGISTTCTANGPYGVTYPYVYNKFFENTDNTFQSFMEKLGRDDENIQFYKDRTSIDNPIANQLPMPPFPGPKFILDDTTSFYTPPVYPAPPTDPRLGIFPFFYKIDDWGVDLNIVDTTDPSNPQCFWCDSINLASGCSTCGLGQPLEIPQLLLPLDPIFDNLIFNTTFRVDGTSSNVAGNPPLASDRVVLPEEAALPGESILGVDSVCAQNIVPNSEEPAPPSDRGFWKRGGDRFCSVPETYDPDTTPWPYYIACPKHGGSPQCQDTFDPDEPPQDVDCQCDDPGVNKALWPDDALDDVIYGIPEFVGWAEKFLEQDPVNLLRNFGDWYPDVADWIEPGIIDGATNNPDTCNPCCFECKQDSGFLWFWKKEIREISERLKSFRDGAYINTRYAAQSCTDVWCSPQSQIFCPEVSAEEEAVSYAQTPTIDGDLADVVECLNWNINDANAAGAIGNYNKFQQCRTTCTTLDCSDLPRTLLNSDANDSYYGVPFDPRGFVPSAYPPDENDLAAMINCLDNCNNVNCRAMPLYHSDVASWGPFFPYSYGDPNNGMNPTGSIFDQNTACPGGVWDRVGFFGSIWWGAINSSLETVNYYCSFNDGPMMDPLDYRNHGWILNVGLSAKEANNQIAKFQVRYDFLKERLNELNKIIGILDQADQKLSDLLDCVRDVSGALTGGPACKLIVARIKFDDLTPYSAMYGWQDEERTPGANDGLWHLVQADARIPTRCDTACNIDQTPTGDPGWPRVRTETKAWGMRRCYELDPENNAGVVKFRVTRVDQNVTGELLKFPNGMPIWQFRSAPNAIGLDFSGLVNPLYPYTKNPGAYPCDAYELDNPINTPAGEPLLYHGAFMMNKYAPDSDPLKVPKRDCWDRVKELLKDGVSSETCAQYYLHAGASSGYGFKFVPCSNF